MAGRPSIYTKELGIEICDWIANNAAGLKTGCIKHEHWPGYETIRGWIRNNTFPEFSDLYMRAREEKPESMEDDIVIIADTPNLDPNDKRVRIDARKWLMSKLKPKKYGDKLDLTSDNKALPQQAVIMVQSAEAAELVKKALES